MDTWTCNGGANQQWNVNANGTITGVQSGLCLDVTGASTANGALVALWTCNGGFQPAMDPRMRKASPTMTVRPPFRRWRRALLITGAAGALHRRPRVRDRPVQRASSAMVDTNTRWASRTLVQRCRSQAVLSEGKTMATPTARSAVAAVLAAALVALAFALQASSSAATSVTTVQEWLTTSDLTSHLTQQPALSFAGSSATGTIAVDDTTSYQTMVGFGAAMTDEPRPG